MLQVEAMLLGNGINCLRSPLVEVAIGEREQLVCSVFQGTPNRGL